MLETEIKKLTAAVEALTKAMAPLTADYTVVEAPVVEAPVEAPVVEVPVEAPVVEDVIDKDTLTRMCIKLSRDGHKDTIKAKLATYGATHVTKLVGNKNYGPFCDWIVDMFNKGETQ
jgi:hypothetical protein